MALDPDYLADVRARPPGDAAAGEIQLLTGEADIEAAAATLRAELRAAGKPEAWADIGRVYTDRYISVHRDAVRFADGRLGTYLRIHVGAEEHQLQCVVLLVTRARRCLVKRMFRNGTRAWELELPRGGRAPGATLIKAGLEELREETGYLHLAAEPRLLGELCVDSALRTSRAAVLHLQVEGAPDLSQLHAAESIDRAELWWSATEMDGAIRSGRMRDSYSIVAWTYARLHGVDVTP